MQTRSCGKSFLKVLFFALMTALGLTSLVPTAQAASAPVKVMHWAIKDGSHSDDLKTSYKNHIATNDIDFAYFDTAKASDYFIDGDFTEDGKSYSVQTFFTTTRNYKYVIYKADKFALVSPVDDANLYKIDGGANNHAFVVSNKLDGVQYAFLSFRIAGGKSQTYSKSTYLGPVKTMTEYVTKNYPNAKVLVSYNQRLVMAASSYGDEDELLDDYLCNTLKLNRYGESDAGAFYGYEPTERMSFAMSDIYGKSTYTGVVATVAFPQTFTVTFEDDDGTELKKEVVYEGGDATPPSVSAPEGYDFTGWDGTYQNVQKDEVVTAQYAIKTFSVRFEDWDGTEIVTRTVDWKTDAEPPPDPVRTGYRFLAWSGDYTEVTENRTIKATYVQAGQTTHWVTFEDYDGTVLDKQEIIEGEDAVPPESPVREGYDFTGWTDNYKNVRKAETVVAQYAIKTFTVTFNDWDDSLIEAKQVDWMADAVPPPNPTRAGHTFASWEGDLTEVTEDRIIKATYTVNSYTVRFLSEGEVVSSQQVVYQTAAVRPPDPVSSNPDHVFWKWDRDVSSIVEDTDVNAVYTDRLIEVSTVEEFLEKVDETTPSVATVRLMADLDLSSVTNARTDFHAILDGNGHSITGIRPGGFLFAKVYGTVRNLTFDSLTCMESGSSETRASRALIGSSAYGATVENCVFTNCLVTANITSGGAALAFLNSSANGETRTVISNVTAVNCRVINSGSFNGLTFGGIVMSAKNTDFYNCRFVTEDRENVAVGGYSHCAGGIVGEATGDCRLYRCSNEGLVVTKLSGDNYKGAGGIVGGASGLTECYSCTNVADIVGAQQGGSGGIVARASKCTVVIDGCVNRGNVTSRYGGTATNPGGSGAGGLIAGNWGSYSTIKIIDSVNYGDISTTTNNCDAGGLVGSFDNQGSGLFVTNAFNYGNVASEQYAGGIVGQLYKHWISVNNIGNSGNVTSTARCAGGFAGRIGNGANHSSYDVSGFMNCGEIVGSSSAALVVGGYGETQAGYIDCHIRVYNCVLAGSVSSATGTVGVLSGALVGSYASVVQGYADANTVVQQQGLCDYYNSEGPQSLATPIRQMAAGSLNSKAVRNILNANASSYGLAPWIRGRSFPELALFGEPAVGLTVILR